MVPPAEMGMPKRTSASSRELTGGLTRSEAGVGPDCNGWAERGYVQQSPGRGNLEREICRPLGELPIQAERRKRHARRRAAQKERASTAWSGSNLSLDGRAASTALNRSTA